uniref:Uncharacterized protein n=1 Tax=Tanacetum cinerariifolium TaxID=118510 RepID=A0A6L2MY52_TANCI|nr:hypothetical protein [Tanacetum cinerariifolium]
MSSDSASFEVTCTSISLHGDPLAWAADFFGLQEPDSPEAAPASLDYVPGLRSQSRHRSLQTTYRDKSTPSYVADSDLKKGPKVDPEEDHANYPADGGDYHADYPFRDEDDDKEPFGDEDDDEEEEHLALANSLNVPVINHVPLAEDTEAFETDEAAPTLAEAERLLALSIPPPSPLTPLSSSLAQIPSPPLPPVPTSLPLPLSPLPPLPASLSIPLLVDRKEDTSEAELPPRKRLCLTALTSRYEVWESSTATPRPTGGHRVDYGFIGTMDAEVRHQRAKEVGYGIRDVWLDPTETVKEVASTTLEGVNARVIELAVNNMPPKRTYAAARAAAAARAVAVAPMTAAAD